MAATARVVLEGINHHLSPSRGVREAGEAQPQEEGSGDIALLSVGKENTAADPGPKRPEDFMIHRSFAEARAIELLSDATRQGSEIFDSDILSCLRFWGFKENTSRLNVMPAGAKFICSDTIGVIRMATGEKSCIQYPAFTQH